MTDQLAGLIGSASLYFGSGWLLLRLYQRAVRSLPADWRDHPELRAAYKAFLAAPWQPAGPLRTWLPWLAGGFGTMTYIGIELRVELAFVAVVAAWWVYARESRMQADARRVSAEYGLPWPTRGRRLAAARLACLFAFYASFLGIAGFLGALVAEVVS
jgi:hypothetical protein